VNFPSFSSFQGGWLRNAHFADDKTDNDEEICEVPKVTGEMTPPQVLFWTILIPSADGGGRHPQNHPKLPKASPGMVLTFTQ